MKTEWERQERDMRRWKRYIYIYERLACERVVCMSVCVYVCVNHLKRRKTSNLFVCFKPVPLTFASALDFQFYFSRGMEGTYGAPSNEAPHMSPGYHQGRLVTYLQNNFRVIFRQWQPAKPRTGMSIIWIVFQQFFSGRWSFLLFFGSLSDSLLSGVTGLFLHVRCAPQQNSQWQFWASVCLMPVSPR